MQLTVFAVFCCARIQWTSGFFAMIGIGYGFIGFFSLLQLAAIQEILSSDILLSFQYSATLGLISRFYEVFSVAIGIIAVKRSFKGYTVITLVLFCYIVATFFLLISVFAWKTFPLSWSTTTNEASEPSDVLLAAGHSTVFYQVSTSLTLVGFVFTLFLLILYRNEFKENVYYLFFTTIFLRVIFCGLSLAVIDSHSRSLQIFSAVIRLISFTFLFLTIVVSTLKNPLDTLYRRIYVNQVQLENQKKFAEWMIDQLPVIVILLDAEGMIRHMNKSAKQTFSYTLEDTLGESFFTLCIQANDSEHHAQIFKDAVKKGSEGGNSFKLSSTNPKDESKQYEWSCNVMHAEFLGAPFINKHESTPHNSRDIEFGPTQFPELKDPNIVVLCLGQDITAQQKREELLVQARNQAEKLSKLKDAFVANVSHELRTPLNCIIGMSNLLTQTILSPHQNEIVNMMANASNSLLHLINDILDFSMIQQEGKLKMIYSWFNLRSLVEDVVLSLSLLFPDANVDFGYRVHNACLDMICCDEKRLRQVLTNLLNNAIKFTQKGHIFLTVHMKYTSDNREQLMFRVADTGIGIKPEDIPKLFTRFTQIEYTYTRKFGGTGLGLAISRTITELLEGEMGVESEFGKGSTFWFTVPTKPKQAENILPPKTSIDEGEKKKLQKPDKLFILLHSGQLAGLMQSTFSEDYDINTQVEDSLDTLCDSLQDYTDKFEPQDDARNPFIAVLIEPTEDDTTAVVQRLHEYRSERLDVHIVVVHSFIGPNDDDLRKTLDIDLISKPIKISRLHLCLCRADKPLYRRAKVEQKRFKSRLSKN